MLSLERPFVSILLVKRLREGYPSNGKHPKTVGQGLFGSPVRMYGQSAAVMFGTVRSASTGVVTGPIYEAVVSSRSTDHRDILQCGHTQQQPETLDRMFCQATGGVAGSAAKNLQDALLGVLRSSEPAALPWRPKLLKALTALGASETAAALVDKLERQANREQR